MLAFEVDLILHWIERNMVTRVGICWAVSPQTTLRNAQGAQSEGRAMEGSRQRGHWRYKGRTPHVPKYGKEVYGLYRRVTPGISGLWQVSGRNNTTYEERVEMIAYYVSNWSV